MNPIAVSNTEGTNGLIVRTTRVRASDQLDYGWMLLALLALVLIASGLGEVFKNRDSN
jgi:hypothetical protein